MKEIKRLNQKNAEQAKKIKEQAELIENLLKA
jgi:hypothetical protein